MQRRKHNLNCIVEGCSTKAYSSRPVFAFPRSAETARLWRQALGIHSEAEIRPSEGVCSLHFGEKYVVKDEGDPRNMWLMPGAVPGALSRTPPPPSHCRMCGASQESVLKNKVSALRRDIHMMPLLDICLDLNSEIHSLLPDGVCEACTSTVRYIAKFAKSCWKAQEVLAEKYAPGKCGKFEPWKRVAYCQGEPPENDPLSMVEDMSETKTEVHEESSENEMIELIPMEEVKQELTPEIIEPESIETSAIQPEEIPQLQQKQPNNSPKTSNSKPRKKPAEPPTKRSRPSDGSTMASGDMYGCDFCAQKFAIKKHLDQHIRTHVRNLAELERKRQLQVSSQFRCLRCRAQFPTADQLKAHFAAQHQNKIQCRECNVSFNFDSLLDKHNAQMHPERVQTKEIKQRTSNRTRART